jgi:hypothetical protein
MTAFPLDPQQNADLTDFIAELNKANVDYLVVGAWAVMAHSRTFRVTKDLDIYVSAIPDNLQRLKAALAAFGAPPNIVALADAPPTDAAFEGFIFGRPPARIDVLTKMEMSFESLRQRATIFSHATLTTVAVIGKDDLIALKRAANRVQDRHDVKALMQTSTIRTRRS